MSRAAWTTWRWTYRANGCLWPVWRMAHLRWRICEPGSGPGAFPGSRSRRVRCIFRNSTSYSWQAATTGWSECFEVTLSNFSIRSSLSLVPTASSMNRISKVVYVGYGGKDAGKDYGEVGVIDAKNDKHIGDIKVTAHSSELLLNKSGTTLFVFISIANQIQVIDTSKRQPLSTWPVSSQRPGDAAFDESTSRLFIGTRAPPEMIVMDAKLGKEVAHLPTAEGMDGVYFDGAHKRVYVSGGRDMPAGFIYIYRQKTADQYEAIGKVPTRAGAGTSFWSTELNRYYVAAPANDKEEAAVLVYEPQE